MRSHKSPAVCFLACLSVIFISCPREGDRVQPRPEDASDVPQDSSEQDGSPIAMETDWPSPPADIPASDFLDESSLPDVDCCEGLLDSADELPVELCSLPCQIQADCAGLFPQASPCETPVCQLVEACAEKSPDMAYQCVLELTEPPECCIADIDCADNDPCTENEGCLANYCVWSPIVSPDCCPDPVLELDFDDGVWPQPIPPVQPSGSTTWSIVDSPCHEGMALYLGDSECRTYYNGQLVDCVPVDGIPCTPETEAEDCPLPLAQCDPVTNGCKPDPPPTTIVLSLRIADVEIPNFPDVALSFDIRTDLEPPFPGSPMQFDILRLHVEPEDSFPIEVFSTKDLFNTDGLCVTAGIDLWEFAGEKVDLVWSFDTLDDTLKSANMRLANWLKAQENHEYIQLELDRIDAKITSIAELAVNRNEPDFITSEVDGVAATMEQTESAMAELQFLSGLDDHDLAPPSFVEDMNTEKA